MGFFLSPANPLPDEILLKIVVISIDSGPFGGSLGRLSRFSSGLSEHFRTISPVPHELAANFVLYDARVVLQIVFFLLLPLP